MKYRVYLEPYSLEPGRVGQDIYKPIYISSHRSPREAAKRIVRLIRGTDSTAREYLRAVNNNPFPIALRYIARETVVPFKALSAAQLRAIGKESNK